MKLRMIVMNGQRIIETEEDGAWKCQEVGKAGKLKPGIYNLYLSQHPDKSKRHDGVIIYSTDSYIYQKVGGLFIMHSLSDFHETSPEIGTKRCIVYDAQGKGHLYAARELTPSRS
jgi:hypothetical protein